MSIIEILPKDTINHILFMIETDRDKFNFLITCKYIIDLTVYFNEKVSIDKIIDCRWFDQFIYVSIDYYECFPLHVKKISLEADRDIDRRTLPNITHLFFGPIKNEENIFKWDKKCICKGYYDMPINGSIPLTVTHLVFSRDFNQPIYNHIPSSVKHLIFGDEFNQRVDSLPSRLTHLRFGHFFNNKVDNLPSTITHLEFGDYFDQPIDHLPSSITHLKLGNYFDEAVELIPTSVTHLILHDNNLEFIDGLPASITHLTLSEYNKYNDLPLSITYLKIKQKYDDHISLSDKYLTFAKRYSNKTIFQVSTDLSWKNSLFWGYQQFMWKINKPGYWITNLFLDLVGLINYFIKPYIGKYVDICLYYSSWIKNDVVRYLSCLMLPSSIYWILCSTKNYYYYYLGYSIIYSYVSILIIKQYIIKTK